MKRKTAYILTLWIGVVTLEGGCAILADPTEIHDADKATKESRELKLITYNIHYGVGLDKKPSLPEIIEIVRPFDVICLNEVPPNVTQQMAEKLDMAWICSGESRLNNAILSKIPIRSARVYHMPRFMGVGERRTMVEAKLENGLTVFALHSGLVPVERDIHLACAKQVLDRCPGPRVLCGDLNCAPNWKAIRGLRRDYKDVGFEKTHQTFPRLRIDYILASEGIEIREFTVGRSRASDHLPVSAVLDLQ